jgi:hypothetical protein
LSYRFWQQQLGGDQGVVGKTVTLSGNNYTVIGVLPQDFDAPRESPEVWVSLRVANPLAAKARGVHFMRTYWRLKPGVTLQQAQADVAAVDQRLEQQYPAENKGRRNKIMSLHERVAGDTRPALLMLFGAVGQPAAGARHFARARDRYPCRARSGAAQIDSPALDGKRLVVFARRGMRAAARHVGH